MRSHPCMYDNVRHGGRTATSTIVFDNTRRNDLCIDCLQLVVDDYIRRGARERLEIIPIIPSAPVTVAEALEAQVYGAPRFTPCKGTFCGGDHDDPRCGDQLSREELKQWR